MTASVPAPGAYDGPVTERDQLLARGRDELARGAYFDAHEHFEAAWHRSVPPERAAIQALVQLAVALHHLVNGNVTGATRVLAKAGRKLDAADTPARIAMIDLGDARTIIDRLRGELAAGVTPDLRSIVLG